MPLSPIVGMNQEAAAQPPVLSGWSKAEIDALARAADPDFHNADYPYYSAPNGCGEDGWKGRLVPNKSQVWEGVEFLPACNQHDRAYMTVGKKRVDADVEFHQALAKAVDDYLSASINHNIQTKVKKSIMTRVPREVKRIVVDRVKRLVPDSWYPWKWIETWIDVTREVMDLVYDEVKTDIEETVTEVRTVTRATVVGPERELQMRAMVDTYYAAVRVGGEDAYNDAQTKQRRYENWLSENIKNRPK